MPNYEAFSQRPFFHVASTQLSVPEFGLNSQKSCFSPNYRCNSSADIMHEHGVKYQEDRLFLSCSRSMACRGSVVNHRSLCPTKQKRAASFVETAQHKHHSTFQIICKSAFSPNFSPFFYGTSHLENRRIPVYYKDTKKGVSPMY